MLVASKLSWIPRELISGAGVASTSRGLVGDTHFAVLPDVQPGHCFLLTIVVQLVRPTSASYRERVLISRG